ncbi:MAG: hypothetical protein Q9196_001482 [Gyalolechia fulgens]
MFLIWLVPCAVARNIQTMLVARFLDGVAGSAFLSVAGGTIGDMFDRSELQAPMMVYSASPFIGAPMGPIVAGFVNYCTSCVPPSGLPMGYYIARLPNGGDGPVPVSGLRWTGPVLDDGRNVANSAPGTSSSGTGKEYEG